MIFKIAIYINFGNVLWIAFSIPSSEIPAYIQRVSEVGALVLTGDRTH
jgi:hypothetical protein